MSIPSCPCHELTLSKIVLALVIAFSGITMSWSASKEDLDNGTSDMEVIPASHYQGNNSLGVEYHNMESDIAARRQVATIEQTGHENTANISQTGKENISKINQSGNAHTATINQLGDDNRAVNRQFGTSQYSETVQRQLGNRSLLNQSGNDNKALVHQIESGSRQFQDYPTHDNRQLDDIRDSPELLGDLLDDDLNLRNANYFTNAFGGDQAGSNNTVYISQYGELNSISTGQFGNSNFITAAQQGTRESIVVWQYGDNNSLTANQTGENELISSRQTGAGNSLTVNQVGPENSLQSIQIGTGNTVTLNQFGFSSASISQSGTNNNINGFLINSHLRVSQY